MKNPFAGKDIGFLIRKSGIAVSVKAGGMISQYLFVYALARLSGPGNLGTFTLSYTIIQLLIIIALLGLDNLLTRKIATANARKDEKDKVKAYKMSLRASFYASMILTIILYTTSEFLAEQLFHKPSLTASLRVISISLPFFTSVVIHSGAYRGIKNMLGFTFYRTTIPLINMLVLLLSYFFHFELLPATGFTMATIITAFGYQYFWKKEIQYTEPIQIEKSAYRLMLRESLPMLMTGSIFFILNWIDNLCIGYFRTEAEVGIYDTAFKIAAASAIILQAVNAIQAPVFAEFKEEGDIRKLRLSVFESNRILFVSTLPITALLVFFPGFLLSFFGTAFMSGALSLSILAVSNMLSAICGSVGILLQMTGYQVIYNRIIMVAALLSILLNIFLIPRYGIVGAAIASSIAKVFQNLASSMVVYRKFGIFSIYIPWFTYNLVSKKNNKE